MSHKIALNGFGRVGRIIYTQPFSMAEQKPCTTLKNSSIDLDSFPMFKESYVSLVDIYKKVQRKYYPDKDVFVQKTKKNNFIL